MSNILEALNQRLRADQVTQDAADLQTFGRDWTRAIEANPLAIVFPESVDEVISVVKLALQYGVGLVPSGGRTGLSGGAIASRGELVLSLNRMNKILTVHPEDQLLVCEAGAATQSVQEAAESAGLYFPVDFASRGSSQIGGNIATNAGGTKVIRYGMMRPWVAGLKVVTGRGELLDFSRSLRKDNSGLDLKQVFIGSEGILGLIVEASLWLTKAPGDLKCMLVAAGDLSVALDLLVEAHKAFELFGFEFFSQAALERVCEQHAMPPPFHEKSPYYFLIEAKPDSDFMGFFDRISLWPTIHNAVLSQSDRETEAFWLYRELISETIAPLKPYKSDISVPIRHIPAFVKEADALISSRYGSRPLVWFGHIGDGNLHFNFLPQTDESDASFQKACEPLSHDLFSLLNRFGGSISAEHGIGLMKKPYLSYSRSPSELALMKEVKNLFDPQGIMNPGKIF